MTQQRQAHDDSATWVSEQDLLADVGRQGHQVTPTQLKHWYKQDCMPHPMQRHMLGQAGSRSFYPPHAPAQLLALCQLHERETRYPHLRFQLWLDGHDIPERAIRRSLRVLVLESFVKLGSLLQGSPRDSLAAAEQIMGRAMPHFGRSTLGRLLHQQVPNADDRRSVLIMFMQLLFGGRPAFGTGSPEEKSLAELFVQALGLEAAQTDRVGGAAPWLPKDITPDLEKIAGRKLLSMKRLARGLFRATREDLDQARQDREAFAENLPRMVRSIERVYGPNPLGMGMLVTLQSDDPAIRAAQIVWLLMMRQAGYGHNIDVISATVCAQVEQCERATALYDQVHTEIPELADAVKAAMQDLRRGETQDAVTARLRALAPQFAPQLQAFWERHPDLAVQWDVAA